MHYDHAVPFALLQAELMALRPVTPDAVEATLGRFGIAVLITKAEHDRLHELGYGRRMPADWDGSDPLARYTAAGIVLEPNAPLERATMGRGGAPRRSAVDR